MSQETSGAESAQESPGTCVDPVAVALALGGASQAQADAFLKRQARLADLQAHHLREQFKQLGPKLWEARLGVLLRIATAFIGIAVVAALVFLVWQAANSNDLVIDAFTVPPNMADRGLSGTVVAAKLSDKIAEMQAQTTSERPAKSYANATSGLKLEIPETGVSLSELNSFLRGQLGHDLHIGGEMVQTDKGIAITVRVGTDGSATVAGAESDTDSLIQKLAEEAYRVTQPYRYAAWLTLQGRYDESVAVYRKSAASGPAIERAWAYNGLGRWAAQFQSQSSAIALFARGHALDPNSYLLVNNTASAEERLGRIQASQRDFGAGLALIRAHGRDYAQPQVIPVVERNDRTNLLRYQGAFLEAAELNRQTVAEAGTGHTGLIEDLVSLHELSNARNLPPSSIRSDLTKIVGVQERMLIGLEAQDWRGVLAQYATLPPLLAQNPGVAGTRATSFDPEAALALAHLRQFTEAEALLKPMPADCYPCLTARAQVAALERQNGRADYWFAHAVAAAPSVPIAESEWGQALLQRGDADGAIAKFKASNAKGPHFADPLEGWGEALMAQNRSALALAKFEEASKYAPNWGRLHLKWGEALVYAGKKDEAKEQFARATGLDLTSAEKEELAAANHG